MSARSFTVLALAAVLGLAGCSTTAPPQGGPATTVSVDLDRQGVAVNRAVLRGYNFGNWMAVADYRDSLAQVPAAALRFPGGNIGDDQDMDAASLDTFKSLLSLVEGQPELMVQTRVFQGRVDRVAGNRPEDAALAVRMARERGMPVRFWEIGNEPDLFSTVRGDTSWNADRYCDVFRAQAAAIRAEDPAALVAGPAVSAAEPGATAFVERFVLRCGDVVDLLTWHIYPTGGEGTEEAALASVSEIDRSVSRYHALWRDKSRNPLGHERRIGFGVTEYGLSWRTDRPRFLADQVNGLWSAEAALRLASSGVAIAHYFAYQGTGYHGLLDVGGVPRPTFYGYRLLSGLEGHFVGAASSDTRLWAHATRHGAEASLLLLNTRDEAISVKLQGTGFKVRQARYFDAAIAESEHPLAELPAGRELVLPARSMSHISLEVSR